MSEKVGLVLSGGGSRAAYEVGVLRAIYAGQCPEARGQRLPEVFCGTAGGAFNAAVIASRLPGQSPSPIDYLTSLWADEIPREGRARHNRVYRKRLDTLQFFDLPFMLRRPFKSFALYFADFGLLMPELARRTWKAVARKNFSSWLDLSIWHDTSPMARLISESIGLEVIRDGETGGDCQRLLRVVATERDSGQPQVFRNADFTDDAGHAIILASCALPILFPSVKVRGKEYLYGGLVMQTPLQPAVDAGCTLIYLVHNEPRVEPRLEGEYSSTREMLNRVVAVALSATLERDLDSRRRTNAMLAAFNQVRERTGVDMAAALPDPQGQRRVVVHQYRPKQVLGGKTGYLNFSRENIAAAIDAGERDATRHDCAESGCIL